MAWMGIRAPNLGPIWAERPQLAITEPLLLIGLLLHLRSFEAQRQIPADLGVKGSRVQISPARLSEVPSQRQIHPSKYLYFMIVFAVDHLF